MPSESLHQPDHNRLLELPRTDLIKPKSSRYARTSYRTRRRYSIHFLVFGLLILQGITLATILTLASTQKSLPDDADNQAALVIPSIVEPQPVITEPLPVGPTTRLQENIITDYFDRNSQPVTSLSSEPAPPAALKLHGAEITQGIQVFQVPENPRCYPDLNHPNSIFCNNSVPLVAGRHTLIRVYAACNGSCPTTETTIRLHLLKEGQVQTTLTRQLSAEMLQRITSMTLPQMQANLENSVNFEFFPPPDWLTGQIAFELEALPQDAPEATTARLSFAKDFIVRKALRVAYLPIEYKGLRPPDPIDIDYWLQRMYPVADVDYYRLPIPDLSWEGEVSKGEILRKLLYTYWLYAQSQPLDTRPDQLFGWLPQELYNGGASDPFWCPKCAGPHSSRVAFGGLRPEQDIGGPRILVHEIAHNLGAQHAWSPTNQEDAGCFKAAGANIRVDPDWPYSTTPHIQHFGIDLYSDPPVIYPPTYYDMMAYCTQPWISPHTYRKIFDSPFLQPDKPTIVAFSNFQPQVESRSDTGTLLVSGIVYPDGTVARPEVIQLEGDAFSQADSFTPPPIIAPPPGDDYCLELQGKDGKTLSERCFDIGFLDLENGQVEASPYFLTLPNVKISDVKDITIRKNRVALSIITPSKTPPEVTINFPNGGEQLDGHQTITWQAVDSDGDLLTYDLLYSPDAGHSWLPLAVRLSEPHFTLYTGQLLPSDRALIRVIANDGFHTTLDESNGLFAIQSLPANSISLLGPSQVEPEQTFEVTVTAYEVTSPGLFGIQFKLDFDPTLVQVDEIKAHAGLELVVDGTIENDQGRLSFAASRRGQVSNLTDQLSLVTIRLTASQKEGELYLDLHDIMAGSRGGLPLSISEVRGLSVQIAAR